MVSDRKLLANRANAKRSTGPRSAKGKTATARNAHRHGLAISVYDIEPLLADVKKLAAVILENFNGKGDYALATRVAEAQIDLDRIHKIRRLILCRALGLSDNTMHSNIKAKPASRPLTSVFTQFQKSPNSNPIKKGLKAIVANEATIAIDYGEDETIILSKDYLALDRYERRALSRRKAAIRDFEVSVLAHSAID